MINFQRLVAASSILALAGAALATTYTVNSTSSGSSGSGTIGTLEYCLNQANGSTGSHTIDVSGVSGTISCPALLVLRTTTFVGPGSGNLTLTTPGQLPLFCIRPKGYMLLNDYNPSVVFSGFRFANCNARGFQGAGGGASLGGVFLLQEGSLQVNDCVFESNSATGGNSMGGPIGGAGLAEDGYADTGGRGAKMLATENFEGAFLPAGSGVVPVAVPGVGGGIVVIGEGVGTFGGTGGFGAGGGSYHPRDDGLGRQGGTGGFGGGGANTAIYETWNELSITWDSPGGFGAGDGIKVATGLTGNGVTGDGGGGGGGGFGGVLFVYGGSAGFTNCTFSDNSTSGGLGSHGGGNGQGHGGALFISKGSLSVSNCTFANNLAHGGDGNDLYRYGGTVNITNTVLASNVTDVNPTLAGSVVANSSAFAGPVGANVSGTGNLGNVAVGLHSPSNLRPLPNSPLVGAGTPAGAPGTDLDGNSRPAQGNPAPTIGAYETAARTPAVTGSVVSPSGSTAIGATGVSVDLLGAVAGTVSAQYYSAGRTGTIAAPASSPYFWTVSTDAPDVSGSVTFDWATVGGGGVIDPSGVQLYRRDGYGLPWSLVPGTSYTANSITATGINGFSEFALGSESNPLPVTLSSFEVASLTE